MPHILPILSEPKQSQYIPILSGAGSAPYQYFKQIDIDPIYLDPKTNGEVPQNHRKWLQIASNSEIRNSKMTQVAQLLKEKLMSG